MPSTKLVTLVTTTTPGNVRVKAPKMLVAVTETDHLAVASSQAVMLVAYHPPSTRAVGSSKQTMLVGTEAPENAVPVVKQAVMLVAYRTGPISNLTTRAWTFSLDGHTFYVLNLGEQGTFVYDLDTEQWAKWQTSGLNTWNMENGIQWGLDIIGGDQSNAIIWKLDPNSFIDDDYKPQTRRVTGALALRNREFIPNYALRLSSSQGVVEIPTTVPATVAYVQLRYSDDQGKTWTDAGTIDVIDGDFTQMYQWLSLGRMQAPNRIFEISDFAGPARIDGADAEIMGE